MKKFTHKIAFIIVLVILVSSFLSAYANIRIMSYNIKDFRLRFDGEPGTITNQGTTLDQGDLEKLEIVARRLVEKLSFVEVSFIILSFTNVIIFL